MNRPLGTALSFDILTDF